MAMVCLLASAGPAEAQSRFQFFEPVTPPRSVQIVASRGLQAVAPENTAPAIAACAIDYIEWAEVDVRLTKDGRHVILHDATLDRTTDGRGPVADITAEAFVKLDAGTWHAPRFKGVHPLTLADLLKAAKRKVNLILNAREIDPERLVSEVVESRMESQVIVSADLPVLARVRSSGKNAVATLARFQPKGSDFEMFVKNVDPTAVEFETGDVTEEWCRKFHEWGIIVKAGGDGPRVEIPAAWNTLLAAGVDWLVTNSPAAVRFVDVRRRINPFPVKIAHHRGTNRYAPENTIPAIRTAVRLGADYIEIDIRTTKDGRFVLVHDGSLNRTTDGTGPVVNATADAIAKLSAGAWFGKPFAETRVPTLDEGLAALGSTSAGYLDAKSIPPEDLVAAMRKYKLVERSVVYQSSAYIAKLRAIEPAVRGLPPLQSAADFETVAATKPFGVDARWSALSAELIARCHQAGIQVFSDALGPNETVEQYSRAIEWGIDVIQTDHPLRVLRAIELHAMN
jgi:glycerophosphoryl diester phosphodiesterase